MSRLCSDLLGAELHGEGLLRLGRVGEAGRGDPEMTDWISASLSLPASFKFLGGHGWGWVLSPAPWRGCCALASRP